MWPARGVRVASLAQTAPDAATWFAVLRFVHARRWFSSFLSAFSAAGSYLAALRKRWLTLWIAISIIFVIFDPPGIHLLFVRRLCHRAFLWGAHRREIFGGGGRFFPTAIASVAVLALVRGRIRWCAVGSFAGALVGAVAAGRFLRCGRWVHRRAGSCSRGSGLCWRSVARVFCRETPRAGES